VRPAVDGVDDVAERVDALLGARRPAERDLGRNIRLRRVERHDVRVDRLALLVQLTDVVGQTTLGPEHLLVVPGQAQTELEAAHEVGLLAQPGGQGGGRQVGSGVEDRVVRAPAHGRPGSFLRRQRTDALHVRDAHAALVALTPQVSLAAHLDLEPGREGVRHGGADAVQPAGDLVAACAELAACVQAREDEFEGRDARLPVDADRDAAAVVADRHDAVCVDLDADRRAVAGQRLVDGVVDDLPDEVVQGPLTRPADVHAWSETDGLEALEDLDLVGAVPVVRDGHPARVRHGTERDRACRSAQPPRRRASRSAARRSRTRRANASATAS
jgi:hypothetical protein